MIFYLEERWEEHFGYLKSMGYAVVIGAFGGNPDWPDNGPLRDQDRWGRLPDHTVDWQWQNAFLDYLAYENIFDTIY
ncbi:MAG: hypothetical protein JXJ04_01810, partial [Spirochaetales bacterium]|nr:hypothetical protein [Spirochaetales bacterium]